jgi:outer membrane protein assembly factor BamB
LRKGGLVRKLFPIALLAVIVLLAVCRLDRNKPPVEPLLFDSTSIVAGDTMKLNVRLSDPDNDSVAGRISWGDGDTTGWSKSVASTHIATLTHVWKDTGTYLVRAQSRDQRGTTSDWTEGRPVRVWRPKWRFRSGMSMTDCPALAADGTVYGGSDSGLCAVNPDGSLKWRCSTTGSVSSAAAVADDGTVYFGSGGYWGFLNAIDPSGTLKWQYRAGEYVHVSPALAADGTVYFGSSEGHLYAVDPSGNLKWRYEEAGISSSLAVAADGTVYFGARKSDSSYLCAIDFNGILRWRCIAEPDDIFVSTPVVNADGTIYFGSSNGRAGVYECYLYAISTDGSLKWRYRTRGGEIQSSPVVGADGTVYVGSQIGDGCLTALNSDGTLKWEFATGHDIFSPALAADGTVYVGSSDGYICAVSNGTLKWRYRVANSFVSPPNLAADGTVYVGSDDGRLYAIVGSSPLADSPWPKFHRDAGNTGRVGGGR